ncbi:MAG: hypothetical protein LBQ88_15705 [Treponema sp.]|nr:hypothetical protein [Treponema sp.]
MQNKQENLASKEKEHETKLAAFYKDYIEQQKSMFKTKLDKEIEQDRTAIAERKAVLNKKREVLASKEKKENGVSENNTPPLSEPKETEGREENGKQE